MYANFESVLIKQHVCAKDGKKSWTEDLQYHVPFGAWFYVKSSDECFFRRPVVFRGDTAVEEFLDSLMVTTNELRNILKKQNPMDQLTPVQMEKFASAEKCHIY